MSGNFDVSQLNNLFSQITQMTGGYGSQQLGKSGMSFNDIAWFANAIGTVSSTVTTDEQKTATIQQFIQKSMNIFQTILSNAQQSAKKEVDQLTQKTQEILADSEKLGAQLDGELTDIQANIEAQSGIVDEAAKALGEVQKAIEEKQAKINELAIEIEKKQKELAEAQDPSAQSVILAEIQGLAVQISELILDVQVQQKNVENLTAAVDNTTEDIEASTQKLAETKQEGLQELAEGYQESVASATSITKTATTGAGNEAASVALKTAGAAAESNVITGATIAPKLFQSAADQQGAATARLTGVAQNITTLAQGIGGLTNSSQILSSFQNSIGGALNNYAGLVGSWDSQLQPVITSLGSLEGVRAAVTELQEDVKTDLGSLGVNENPISEVTEVQNENQEVENTLITPTFDTTRLKFGL